MHDLALEQLRGDYLHRFDRLRNDARRAQRTLQATDASKEDAVDQVVRVTAPGHFGALTNGVYTLAAGTTYLVVTEVDLGGARLVASANTVISGYSSENCRIKSTGLTGVALLTSIYTLPLLHITIEADVALDLDAVDSNQALDWDGVNFTNCATVGTIANYGNVIWRGCALLSSANLTFDGSIGTVGFDGCLFVGIAGQTTIDLPATFTATRRFRVIYSAFVVFGGATGIDVDVSATIPVESYILDTVNFSGGATYTAGVPYSDNKALFVNNKGISNSASIGVMTMTGNSTVTAVAVTDVDYKTEGVTTLDAGVSQKFTMPVDNRLTYGGAINREFRVTATVTLTSANNTQVGVSFAKNGSVVASSEVLTTTDGNGRHENIMAQAVVPMAENDYIEVWVKNATDTRDITVTDFNVVVEALN